MPRDPQAKCACSRISSNPVAGQNVVIVEDIIDNGLTLQYLRALLGERNPASLRACVLFDKPYHRHGRGAGRVRGPAGA